MKVVSPIRSRRNLRTFVAAILSYLMLAGQVAPLALAAARPAPAAPPKAEAPVAAPGAESPRAAAVPAPLAPLAPNIVATKTAAVVDTDADGAADPGEKITYTVTITNNGTADATAVQFTDDVDTHTTPVSGTAALAAPDSYTTIGDVNINVPANQGVLNNDVNLTTNDNTGLTIVSYGASTGSEQTSVGSSTPTAQNGTVTVNSDGSFTYDPQTGFTGTDTFKYAAKTGGGTAIATVTITITGKIWFIDNNSSCSSNCDGRLSHPFKTLAAFNSANGGGAGKPAAGDSVFIYESATAYTGPVTFLNNQKFVGQDATATIETITGLSTPSGSTVLPAMSPSNGTIVNIQSAANAINLGQGNLLRGFSVTATTGAKISGSGFGTLTVGNNSSPDVSLSGAGQALSLTNGTLANTSGFLGVASSSSSSTGVTLDNVSVAGAGTVSFGSTSVSGAATSGIVVANCTTANSCGGTIAFGNTSVTGGTDGVVFTNNNAGSRTFGTLGVSGGSGNAFRHFKGASSTGGGNVTVNGLATLSTANPGLDPVEISDAASGTTINFAGGASVTKNSSGGEGVHLSGANGGATLTFASLTVQTSGGTGLNLASTTTTATVNVTNNTGTVNNTAQAAPAIVANGIALNANFNSIKSSGGANGVSLTNVTGTSNFGSGAISGNSGDAFFISGGTISVSYSGTIASGSAHSVNVSGMTGGGATFSGAITDNDTGILLNNNTGATFTFSGGITASTGANDSFTATGGGTVNVTGTNTITNTTGKAVNIANTTIGGSGATFQSINHDASNSGTNSAIILDHTGAGTFTVSGTGGSCTTGTPTCTGGTLQNIRGADAISLNTVGGLVTLNNMMIQNVSAVNDSTDALNTRSGVDGIQGQAVSAGLTVNTCVFQNISDSGINGSVGGAGVPSATSFNGLTVSNSTFTNMNRFNVANKADNTNEAAIFVFGLKGTVSVTNNSFSNDSTGLLITTDTSGTLDMTVTKNTFTTMYKDIGAQEFGLYGISVTQTGSLNSVVRVGDKDDADATLGNTFTNGGGVAAVRVTTTSTSTGTMKAEINRNTSTVTDHSTNQCSNALNPCQDYNFPQGGFALLPAGSGNYEAIVGHNTFDQVMHADGGIGQLSIQAHKGTSEFIIQNNTFKLPWDAPIMIQSSADGGSPTSDVQVKMTGNTYVGGTVGGAGTDLGGPSPFEPAYFQALNGGRMDLTVQNEGTFPANDPSTFANSFHAQTTAAGDILNLFLQNDKSVNGYELKASSGTTFNLFRNGSASGTPAGVLHDNSVTGGSNNANTDPPVVNLSGAGTVTLSNTAPTLPNITVASLRPEPSDRREQLARANTPPAADAAPRVAFAGATASADVMPSLRERLEEVIPSDRATADRLANSKRGAALGHTAGDSSAPLAPEPAAAPFAACSPQGFSGGHLCVDIGTLKQGDSVQITFQVTVNNLPNLDATDLSGGPHVANTGSVSGSNFSPVNTNTATTTVDLFHTTTNLASNNNPSNGGTPVTFTATVAFDTAEVSPTPSTPTTPTGTVQFFSDSNPITCTENSSSTETLSGGQATCTTSALSAGTTHSITATYSGDGNYNTSNSNTVSQQVLACDDPSIVTKTADDGSAGTLRYAIAHVCTGGTVNFQIPDADAGHIGGVYTITLGASGEIPVGVSMNIVGPNSVVNTDAVVVKGGGASRVFNVSAGTVNVSNLTVTGGSATGDGGGLLHSGGTLSLAGMLFNGNTATGNGGGVASTGGTLNAVNSTFSGNTATDGGGLFNSTGTTNLVNVTVSANTANGVGGGLRNASGTFNVVNSIVAGNTATTSDPDLSGTFASGGHNLVGKSDSANGFTNGSNGDQIGTSGSPLDPQLGALANNGGPTKTHALLTGSTAVDAGADVTTLNGAIDNVTTTVTVADATAIPAGVGFVIQIDSEQMVVTAKASNTLTVTRGAPVPHNDGAAVNPAFDQRGTPFARKVDASADTPSTPTVDIGAYESQPPTAVDDTASVAEDSSGNVIDVLANDSTAPDTGETKTVIAVTQGSNGGAVAVANAGANVTYSPASNFSGTDTFTYTVSDGHGGSDSATVTVTVNSVNDAPTTSNNTVTVLEDHTYTFTTSDFPFADTTDNPPNTLLNVIITSAPAAGTLSDNGTQITGGNVPFAVSAADLAGGKLTFAPAADANGSGYASFNFEVQDNGGTAGGGSDTSTAATMTVNVTAVNDAPSFTKGGDQTVLEDAGAQTVSGWATAISAGPADESGQTLTFNVTANTNTALFSAQPAVDSSGTLTYTPAANANGSATITLTLQDNGGTANGGSDTSAGQTFVINVTAVNDAPSFTKGADQNVNEDAGAQTVSNWATNISAGPADENGQTLTFNVTNDNNALFSSQPAVSSTGTLTYTPAANAFGTTTVSVTLSDNGGTANNGADTSGTQTFTITVNAVADTPSVTPATTNEDTQTTSGLVITPNANDGSEVTHFKITNILHGTLFKNDGTTQINAGDFITVAEGFGDGTTGLKFTPAADYNGGASFDVQASTSNTDAGLGGSVVTASITVNAVNDAPSFTKGPDQSVPINAGAQTVNNWATNIAPGPVTATDESGQTLNFIVTNDNNALFTVGGQPAVSSSGTLTYTPTNGVSGQATVSVSLHDNGGTSNGGSDTSAVQTFTITVGQPSVKVQDAKQAEPTSGTANMLFTVVLSTPLASQTVTVNYQTADDSGGAHPATSGACGSAGADYQSATGSVVFQPGETIKTVPVTICSDGSNEPDETFFLNLTGSPDATISDSQAVGTITQANPAGTFIISEIRTSGPGGSADDFVELYNNTDSPIDASGYGLFKTGASCTDAPVLVAALPGSSGSNTTVIPARGHYLLVGSGYSLSAYAAGDQTLTSDIENDRNVALFTTSDVNGISSANRLDAVGFGSNVDTGPVGSGLPTASGKRPQASGITSAPPPTSGGVCDLFREGANLPAASGSTLEYSFFRKECDLPASCTGKPKDTNDNSQDFLFADTLGTPTTMGQRLGAPGPEGLNSPINRDATLPMSLLDSTVAPSASVNRFRDPTPNTPNANTAAFGTLNLRRRVTNNTGGDVTRLRFRVIEVTTYPNASGNADLRAITSSDVSVSNVHDTTTCVDRASGTASNCTVNVKGTLLEQPPTQTSKGGGYNSTLSVDLSGLPGGKLAANQSVEVQLTLGVMATGQFRILVIVEALP